MASTRNKNTKGNYYLEQRNFRLSENYKLYENSQYGKAYETMLPGDGLNVAKIPRSQLSYNPIDIESSLFGINSTNLVMPSKPVQPKLMTLQTVNVYNKPVVFLPEPLVIEKRQRPHDKM
jgi:hypothetical protein